MKVKIFILILLLPWSSFAQVERSGKCDLIRASLFVKELGGSQNDFKIIKCLAQSAYNSTGLLINELRPIQESKIPNKIKNSLETHPEAAHVLMCLCGLRYITGGLDFKAVSRYKFKASEEYRRGHLLTFDDNGIPINQNLKFFGYWMSQGTYYIAPQDAQMKIIQKWKDWHSKITSNYKFHPLRNPRPEDWLW